MSEPILPAGFSRIAIFGPGLLGGSIAMALRERVPDVVVSLWGRRPEALEMARSRGLCDIASTDAAVAARGAGLLILATPVEVMANVWESASPGVAPGAVVTDVGSVKSPVVRELASRCAERSAIFIGSHPMAGSENAGLSHARPTLFDGAVCIVTPSTEDTSHDSSESRNSLARLRQFWGALGCEVVEMDPEAHDEAVAHISHLPHVAASAVVNAALGHSPGHARFIGPGFRDTTRVAAGDPDLWAGILMANAEAVIAPLREASHELAGAADRIARGDREGLRQFLDRARKLRQSCAPAAVAGTPAPTAADGTGDGEAPSACASLADPPS